MTIGGVAKNYYRSFDECWYKQLYTNDFASSYSDNL